MQFLKQSTAVTVLAGPFVDATDGYTPEEALSPSVLLDKNGAGTGAANDGTAAHDDAGYYTVDLDATDTNTVGRLTLIVESSSTHLAVRHDFQVIDTAAYDRLFGDGATLYDSEISDLESHMLILDAAISDAESLIVSDLASQFTIIEDFVSDIYSDTTAIEAGGGSLTAAQASQLSQVHSDTISQFVVIEDFVSDIYSDTTILVPAVSDLESHMLILDTAISDAESLIVSDLASQFAVIEDFVSDIYSDTTILVPAVSDLESHMLILDSAISDAESLIVSDLASQFTILEDFASDTYSGLVALNDVSVADVLTTQMTESYAANGVAPTLAQAIFAIHQTLMDFSISGTTITVEQLDGTTAFLITLDDGSSPTSANRA